MKEYPLLKSSYNGVEVELNSSCLKFPDKLCIELIKIDRDKPCEKCIMSKMWEKLQNDEKKV